MNYDETVFVNPDKLGLDEGDTLDELYRKLGKAYYEGDLKIHYRSYYLYLIKLQNKRLVCRQGSAEKGRRSCTEILSFLWKIN